MSSVIVKQTRSSEWEVRLRDDPTHIIAVFHNRGVLQLFLEAVDDLCGQTTSTLAA